MALSHVGEIHLRDRALADADGLFCHRGILFYLREVNLAEQRKRISLFRINGQRLLILHNRIRPFLLLLQNYAGGDMRLGIFRL